MYWPAFLLAAAFSSTAAQLTAESSVAPELRPCYESATLLNRNNLPPTTMAVLIDIIQKVEDNPNVNLDLRTLSAILLHSYRQDGIEYHAPESAMGYSAHVLPYAPTFHSFHRHKLLLKRLIPNNLQVLANDTLQTSDKCALHNMLSTTVDARLRGDEGACNQLAQYRSSRTPRRRRMAKDTRSNLDVEVLDISTLDSVKMNGHMRMRHYNSNDDVEYNDVTGSRSERQVLGDSQCPLLGGVVHTTWGAVSAGNLIAGIAAGAQAQRVALSDLTTVSLGDYADLQQYVTSIYPATLSGDLAEAALLQGVTTTTINIGTAGGWNSTQARKHYMLQSRINNQMTDPEIRGDIDGFVLGSTVNSVLSTYSSLKLSQLLDMYYSARNGVFNSRWRACNRRELSQEYITNENLVAESYAFAFALNNNMPTLGTITSGLSSLVTTAVTNFQTYTTNNLHDVTCSTSEIASLDYRLKTNLYLVVDSAWQFETVYPAVSYILDNIEVGKYGSSVTLLSGFDGSIVVNKTFSPADFHSHYTLSRHQSLLLGVNLQTTLTNVRTLMLEEMEHERRNNYVGGNSTILLFLINSGNLQNNEQVLEQAKLLNETVPDVRVLFATASNQMDNLWNLVRDMHTDIHTVSLSSNGLNVETALAQVMQSINRVGRRIVNPLCGAEWNSENTLSGSRHFDDFVEPQYTNFYAVHPNYFYHNNDNRKVRISRTGGGTGSLVICHSRVVFQPRQNSTNVATDDSSLVCQTLGNSGNVEISLVHACDGYWTVNSCPSFHISVHSVADANTATSAVCTDNACRFPYSIRYQVQIEDFGCFSSGRSIVSNIFITLSALSMFLFRWA